MNYNLMHKNILVADILLDDLTGNILKIGHVYNLEHIPCGVLVQKNNVDRMSLNEWWLDRSIPSSREGIKESLEILNISSTKLLLVRCLGLSLSDHYWIKQLDSNLNWHDVNFFENDFSNDIGDILIGKNSKLLNFDFSSPDNTSDGFLKKRWKIINGKRCLIKGGSNPFVQQPFNEEIASLLMKKLNINHVEYSVLFDGENAYSVCEDFIDCNTELVSAWRVMKIFKKDNNTSVYQHFINCAEKLGIKNIKERVNEMIIIDYIIGNEDRHQNNFGLIRDSDTLKWLGFAPIFDSGSSLGYNTLTEHILNKQYDCKPFKKTHEEQLKLVTSFEWIDFEILINSKEEIKRVLKKSKLLDDIRIETILESIMNRIKHLEKLALEHHSIIDNISEDIEKDSASSYH